MEAEAPVDPGDDQPESEHASLLISKSIVLDSLHFLIGCTETERPLTRLLHGGVYFWQFSESLNVSL